MIYSPSVIVFSINAMTGEVMTRLNLDRETVGYYTLNVSASDAGNPSLTSYILMPITVGDINDNNPIFRAGVNQTYSIYEVNIISYFIAAQSG